MKSSLKLSHKIVIYGDEFRVYPPTTSYSAILFIPEYTMEDYRLPDYVQVVYRNNIQLFA